MPQKQRFVIVWRTFVYYDNQCCVFFEKKFISRLCNRLKMQKKRIILQKASNIVTVRCDLATVQMRIVFAAVRIVFLPQPGAENGLVVVRLG